MTLNAALSKYGRSVARPRTPAHANGNTTMIREGIGWIMTSRTTDSRI